MADQEKRISYQAGITRSPSDFLCGEGELAECIGLTSDGEELKVLTPLKVKVSAQNTGGRRLLFVHKPWNGVENYIYEGTYNSHKYLYCGTDRIDISEYATTDSVVGIKAIGKTMIVNISSHILYLLWKYVESDPPGNSGYQYVKLQYPLPDLEFRPQLYQPQPSSGVPLFITIDNGRPYGDIVRRDEDGWKIVSGKQDDYNNLVVGLYSKNVREAESARLFTKPFFLRAALKLYDDTYTYITNPILLFPSVRKGTIGFDWNNTYLRMKTICIGLLLSQNQDYSDYSDIVKDVVVFASEGVNTYDLTGDQPLINYTAETAGDFVFDYVASSSSDLSCDSKYRTASMNGVVGLDSIYFCLRQRDDKSIIEDLKSVSNFYKICSLGIKPLGYVDASEKIPDHVLENLTTQEQLPYDDYFSRNELTAGGIEVYNSRLNLFDIKRGMFGGFSYFMPWDYDDDSIIYKVFVKVKTDEKDVWVSNVIMAQTQMQGFYFFYPDTRATKVIIYKRVDENNEITWQTVCNQDLTEHEGLHGAFYLKGLPNDNNIPSETYIDPPTSENDFKENLPGMMATSEVNNPFVFLAHGYNRVGTGYVIGMAAQTQALSQGQFGQYPIVVFTTDGIWMTDLNSEGLFTNVRPHPNGREVAFKENPAITPVDGAIFFVSKKGLMVLEGSKVTCVSEKMNGRAFATDNSAIDGRGLPSPYSNGIGQDIHVCSDDSSFLAFLLSANLRIAYDYVDGRLLLLNSSKEYCWVYSIKTGGFSKMVIGTFINVVNNYPDYLMQGITYTTENNVTTETPGAIYTLYEKDREDLVSDRQRGFLLTRPLKLGGALTVASLRELKNVGYWEEGENKSEVRTILLVSDDLVHWYEDTSRFGAAAKYFRIALFVHLLPTERLSGTILKERAVRTGQLR